MEIKLTKKPKNPIIIEGFPGLGLIATISTEYLIKHLNATSIGYIWSKNLLPIAAVHDNKVIQPLELYYAEKENILIVHALSDVRGLEWEIGEALVKLYDMLKAKEIITVEGIMSKSESNNVYAYCSNQQKRKKFETLQVQALKEGIIMGVTASLLLKNNKSNVTGLFVESHSSLPDSKSAAKIIEVLNNYLSLNIDIKPLISAAEKFEQKLKSILEQSKQAREFKRAKELNYLG